MAVELQNGRTRAAPFLWADGAEDMGRAGALVVRCAGPGATPGPTAGDLVLLADPGLILEPDLYPCARGVVARDLPHEGGEFFLNASTAYSFCA